MKTVFLLLLGLWMIPYSGVTQTIENIDEITPFHEGIAAIRKGNSWAFINSSGEIMIDYRKDLVWSESQEGKYHRRIIRKEPVSYPYFSNERCLIKQSINGVEYYGYIDKAGKIVIEPEYLNATPFEYGYAIVHLISKEELGRNDLLDKRVVSYSYDEIMIDPSGEMKMHLQGPEHLIYKKDKLKQLQEIQSYMASEEIVAIKLKQNGWKLSAITITE